MVEQDIERTIIELQISLVEPMDIVEVSNAETSETTFTVVNTQVNMAGSSPLQVHLLKSVL